MQVTAVHRDDEHRFSKAPVSEIRLLEGLGVEGDAHAGITVQHRSRVARDPSQPNLRQVHLIHAELFEDLAAAGHVVRPGDLGENVTTSGVDLLGLPRGTMLRLGSRAVLGVTGLRNPCRQIDAFDDGLLRHVVSRDDAGEVLRLAGVMAVVLRGGPVRAGDPLRVRVPEGAPLPLEPV